jgi:hypothetical protein
MVLFQVAIRFHLGNAILFLSLISGETGLSEHQVKAAAVSKQLSVFYRFMLIEAERKPWNVVKNNTFGQGDNLNSAGDS